MLRMRNIGKRLDGEIVKRINSKLKDQVERKEPFKLEQRYECHQGTVLGDNSFIFDDPQMWREYGQIYLKALKSAKSICSWEQEPRGVIDFACWNYNYLNNKVPYLMEYVEDRSPKIREQWWLFERPRNQLYKKLQRLCCCIVVPRVAKYINFCMVNSLETVFDSTLYVIPTEDYWTFGVLQSKVHQAWAKEHSSKARNGFNYSISKCYNTFPFPKSGVGGLVDQFGKMVSDLQFKCVYGRCWGMTKLYDEIISDVWKGSDIINLGRAHEYLDQEVLRAYGWSDLMVSHPSEDSTEFDQEVVNRLYELNYAYGSEKD